MSRPVILAENLGKLYTLSHQAERQRYVALRDVIADKFRSLLDSGRGRKADSTQEDFWALQDVSFEVKKGEVLGIIGRNGAGKSTLLKILSRITEPTRGRVHIRGRVASLLEVGTGFHPELTGRENIYLNGAILGMSRREIRGKFDEIVAFAEIEKFIDMPVKRYSSGMYVRLAFAVAAHLEPEILIVDEVLAVGDVLFQEKCLGKINEVSNSDGRTVLFVSHNLEAIQALCNRSILLINGRVGYEGVVDEAVKRYLQAQESQTSVDTSSGFGRRGVGGARILGVRLMDDASAPGIHFKMGEPLVVSVRVRFSEPIQNPILGLNITTDTGVMVADCRSTHSGLKPGLVSGEIEYRIKIEKLMLYPRTYVIEPWVTDETCAAELDWVRHAATFIVSASPGFAAGAKVDAHHGISFIPTSCAVAVPADTK